MEENHFYCSAGDSGNAAVYRHRRRNRVAPVGLAASAPVRLAADHLLAGTGTSVAVPYPIRRSRMARFHAFQSSPSHGRALSEYDLRRAGTIPATDARTVRFWPISQRKQGAIKSGRRALTVGGGPTRLRTVPVYRRGAPRNSLRALSMPPGNWSHNRVPRDGYCERNCLHRESGATWKSSNRKSAAP